MSKQIAPLFLVVATFLAIACGRSGLNSAARSDGDVLEEEDSSVPSDVARGAEAGGTGGAGGAPVPGDPWLNLGHDPQGSRRSTADTSGNTGRLRWKYAVAAAGAAACSPVITADDTVYARAGYDTIIAVGGPASGNTGVLRWSYTMPPWEEAWSMWNSISLPVVGADGTAYFIYDRLYALAAPSKGTLGTVKWTASISGLTWGAGPLGLYATVGGDGTLYTVTDYLSATQAPASGTLGSARWRYESPGSTTSGPVIGPDGTVYYSEGDGIAAIVPSVDGGSGSRKWSYKIGKQGGALALGSDGTVYVESNGKLYAIAPPTTGTTGVFKWSFDTRSASAWAPAIALDGTVYITSTGGTLFAIVAPPSGTTGVLKWSYKMGNDSVFSGSSPALGADGTVFVGANDGNLYALGAPRSGTAGVVKWIYQLGGFVGSPAIGGDGTVYVCSDGGFLHAIR